MDGLFSPLGIGVLQSVISSLRKISTIEQCMFLLTISILVGSSETSTWRRESQVCPDGNSLSREHVPSKEYQICSSIFALWSSMKQVEVLQLHPHHLFAARRVWSLLLCIGGLYHNPRRPWGRGWVPHAQLHCWNNASRVCMRDWSFLRLGPLGLFQRLHLWRWMIRRSWGSTHLPPLVLLSSPGKTSDGGSYWPLGKWANRSAKAWLFSAWGALQIMSYSAKESSHRAGLPARAGRLRRYWIGSHLVRMWTM